MTKDGAEDDRWLSTHEAADLLGCHPQTVRDRCARGELAHEVDPVTGRRRIAESAVEELAKARGHIASRQPARSKLGFQASLTAELAGALSDEAALALADHVLVALTDRDRSLISAVRRAGALESALRDLAGARWWQRRRVVARLRREALLPTTDERAK